MKIFKNICLIGLLILCFIKIDVVSADEPEFYTKMTCNYSRISNKNEKITIDKMYTSDGIVWKTSNADIKKAIEIMKKPEGLWEEIQNFIINISNSLARIFSPDYDLIYSFQIYDSTTECPSIIVYMDSLLFGGVVGFYDDKNMSEDKSIKNQDEKGSILFSPFKAYVLNSSTHSEEDIYNELPICEYRTDETSSTNNEYYTLTFTPIFEYKKITPKGKNVLTLTYNATVKENKWESAKKPSFATGNASFLVCPEYASYNAYRNEYILTNQKKSKSENWKKAADDKNLKVLSRYYDFSSQLSVLDGIKENYRDEWMENFTNLYSHLNGFFNSCNEEVTLYKDKNLDSKRMKNYHQKNSELFYRTLSVINKIKLDNNYTIKDIMDKNMTSKIYVDIKTKYDEILDYFEERNERFGILYECTYEKLLKQGDLSDEEKQALKKEYKEYEENMAAMNKELKKIKLGLNIDVSDLDCSYLLDEELLEWVRKAFTFIQIGGVILVVILGMIDFGRAVTSTDEKEDIKKAWQRFVKRLIAVGCLILLPFIIEFVLNLVDIPGLTNKNPLCK